MRNLLIALLGVVVVAAATRGDDAPKKVEDKSAPAPGSYAAIKKDYDAAMQKFGEQQKEIIKAFQEAKTDEERKQVQERIVKLQSNSPGAAFGPRFLEFVEKNPKAPEAFDALFLALQGTDPFKKDPNRAKVIAALKAGFTTKADIKKALPNLATDPSEPATKLVEEVIAKNPDRKVQAIAVKSMVDGRKMLAQIGERVKANELVRKNVETRWGKEVADSLIGGVDQAKKDSEKWAETLKKDYADVFPDLSVGKTAPEVVSHDLAGKEVKLSALRGKVVVLDIWATWCPPCRAMIPHEREMVGRLKGKPFALISISADAEKETLTKFLEKESMPWTHWWNGARGGILEAWEVDHFPTIYVLDAKGVIRYKEIRGEELEKAVEQLLKDMGVDLDAAKKG